MAEGEIIVVGAGPAGASAALALAELGCRVLLVEQRERGGGAIHRQPLPGVAPIGPAGHTRRWTGIERQYAGQPLIRTLFSTVYVGIDGTGRVLLDDRKAGRVTGVPARGLVLATGATEKIHPFEGWDLPGVMTLGGAQMLLKETGTPPQGPILVAGSGPLLYAAAAQLSGADGKIIGILERGRPLRLSALAMLLWPRQALQGSHYLLTALRLGLRCDTHVVSASTHGNGLEVRASDGRVFHPSSLLIHDGIAATLASPVEGKTFFPVETAGDGREVLGADAMPSEGRAAAHRLARQLGIVGPQPFDSASARRFQAFIAELFAHDLPVPGPQTMLCRCEGRRFGDLATLQDLSPREIKLAGRIGMGACQGRFCSHHVQTEAQPKPDDFRAEIPRWPLRPVAVSALADAHRPGDPSRSND